MSRGRLASVEVLVLERAGGLMIGVLLGRGGDRCCGRGGDDPFTCDRPEPALSSVLIVVSDRGISDVVPQCCASIERLSSIGVKITAALAAGRGRGCGIGGLVN